VRRNRLIGPAVPQNELAAAVAKLAEVRIGGVVNRAEPGAQLLELCGVDLPVLHVRLERDVTVEVASVRSVAFCDGALSDGRREASGPEALRADGHRARIKRAAVRPGRRRVDRS